MLVHPSFLLGLPGAPGLPTLITAAPTKTDQDPDASYDINDDDNDPTPQDNGDNK